MGSVSEHPNAVLVRSLFAAFRARDLDSIRRARDVDTVDESWS